MTAVEVEEGALWVWGVTTPAWRPTSLVLVSDGVEGDDGLAAVACVVYTMPSSWGRLRGSENRRAAAETASGFDSEALALLRAIGRSSVTSVEIPPQ